MTIRRRHRFNISVAGSEFAVELLPVGASGIQIKCSEIGSENEITKSANEIETFHIESFRRENGSRADWVELRKTVATTHFRRSRFLYCLDGKTRGGIREFSIALSGGRSIEAKVSAVLRTGLGNTTPKSANSKDVSISAAMPGRVVKVNVKAGDTVSRGQALAVIEAMKMENEVFCSAAGTLKSVNVQVGEAVTLGSKLFVVSPSKLIK